MAPIDKNDKVEVADKAAIDEIQGQLIMHPSLPPLPSSSTS